MNSEDMKERGFVAKQVVTITSQYNGVIRQADAFKIVPYNIPRNCCATYFPEANVLVPIDSYAHTAKTPSSKSVIVKIEGV
ncbi:MAG: hypothetical protein COB81_08810 [Flavobacteriaceae bacterium]|nr:MAG: hypothetical protein COB81_08810 [Flavobacteriaceae bacterium]